MPCHANARPPRRRRFGNAQIDGKCKSLDRARWCRSEIRSAGGRIDASCEPVERVGEPLTERVGAVSCKARSTRTVGLADQSLAELRIVEHDDVLTADVFHLFVLLLESSMTRLVVVALLWADWASTRTHDPPT